MSKKYLQTVAQINSKIETSCYIMGYSPDVGNTGIGNTIDNTGICNTIDNFFIALASDSETKNFNSISAKVPFVLTHKEGRTFSLSLPRNYDAFGSMEFLLYPNEDVESINLFLYNIEDDTKDTKLFLKGIDNVGNTTFSFFENPFYNLPYFSLSIDVIFGNITSVYNRILWITGIIYTNDTKKLITDIYTEVPTEKEILENLKKIHICPVCSSNATFTCNCYKKDSKCSNGHSWYYDRRKNKIITGVTTH